MLTLKLNTSRFTYLPSVFPKLIHHVANLRTYTGRDVTNSTSKFIRNKKFVFTLAPSGKNEYTVPPLDDGSTQRNKMTNKSMDAHSWSLLPLVSARRESLAGTEKMPPDSLFYSVKWQSANFDISQICMVCSMGKMLC